MNTQINSGNTFTGKIYSNIVLKNAEHAKRFQNIINEYARATADKPNKNLYISKVYHSEDQIDLLHIQGKDLFITNNLMEDYLEKMSDSEIVKKFVKIADYLQLKYKRSKTNANYIARIINIEGKVAVNKNKSKVMQKSGKTMFAKQFAKIAELNQKTADNLKIQREKFNQSIDIQMRRTADGDNEILEDIILY